MASSQPGSTAASRSRSIIFAALAVTAALVGVLGHHSSSASTSSSTPSTSPTPSTATPPRPPGPPERPEGDSRGALGEADGVVPDGVTVFDDRYPAVAKLGPALRRALRQAGTDAARSGVTLNVDSGWRSATYQQQLLDQAIARYGSEKEAARWVATPATSEHVSGNAVDIGPPAAAWLSKHGAAYGLCQIYRNEAWHFELRPDAVAHGCTPMYADPTQDPRMRR